MPRLAIAIPAAVAFAGCVSYQPLALEVCTAGDCAGGGDHRQTAGDRHASDGLAPGDAISPGDATAGDAEAGDAMVHPGDITVSGDPALLDPCDLDPAGDTPGTAKWLNLGLENPASLADTICLDDVDYFAAATRSGDVMTLELRWTANGEPLTWRAVNCADAGITDPACPGETTDRGVSGCVFVADGADVCVEVTAPGLSFTQRIDYAITVGVDANPSCMPDSSEPHNDEIWPFDLPGDPPLADIQGTLCQGDVADWYRFEPEGNESTIAIEVSVDGGIDGNLLLTDCTGSPIDSSGCRVVDTTGDTVEEVQCALWFDAPAPGYCFGVFPPPGLPLNGSPYAVRITNTQLCGGDSAEPNDVRATHHPYQPGTTDTVPYHLCLIDRDWFGYANPSASDVDVEIAIIYPDAAFFGPFINLELLSSPTITCPGVVTVDASHANHARKICGATIPAGDALLIEVEPNPVEGQDYIYDYYVEITPI